MRAKGESKPVDSPGESGEQSGRAFAPLARVPAHRAVFSRFRGGNALNRVSVRLASKRPFFGPFRGLIRGRFDLRSAQGGMRCLMRFSMRAKAHRVTFCHRPFEWPFFRVSGVERRSPGFPFGWRRNPPKRGVSGPYPWAL